MEDTQVVGILVVVIVHTMVAEVTRKAMGVLHTQVIRVERIQAIVVRHKTVRVEHSLGVAVEVDMPIVEVARRVVIAVVCIAKVDHKLAVVQVLHTLVAEAVPRQRNLGGSVGGTVAVGGIAVRKVTVQTFKSSLVQVAFGSRDSFGATG